MNITKFIGVLSLLLTICIGTKAQVDSVLNFSLSEAQNYAIENFFLSKNAKLDIESAKKKVWETTAIGLPHVTAGGEYQRYLDDSLPGLDFSSILPPGTPAPAADFSMFTRDNFTYNARVSQLIFSGEYFVGLQASKVYKLLSEENYEKVKVDLKENISGSYFTILILKENERVLRKTLNNLSQNLEHSKKILEVGLIEDTDVDQLDLSVKRTENQLNAIHNQLNTMERMFQYQLGIEANVSVELTDSLETLLAQNIINPTNYSFDLVNHIDYRVLSTNENLQRLSLNREKTLLLPRISGYYTYMDMTSVTSFSPPKHMIGVSANWTIFQSGMRTAKISQAKIELEKAKNMKYQEAQRLTISAQQAQYDYETALIQYNNEKISFNLSERIFDNATARYKEGFVSSLDLSIINTQYLQAQLSFAQSIQSLLVTKVALDKAFSKL